MAGAVLGAVVNIAANLLLIPVIGMYGAAFAALMAYFTIALYSFLASRNVYPMKYEGLRLGKIAIAVIVPAVAWYAGFQPEGFSDTLWKIGLLFVYLFLLFAMGFFTQTERMELRRLLKWRG